MAGKEKQKVDAVSLTTEEEARAKKEASKVCKQRRCVHGRLHPHYFRPKKFFPICLWNQLPVKSLLLFGAYSTRSPAERTGSRDQRNCESSNRLLPLACLGKFSLCLPTSWPADFQFALSTSMEIHLRWKACLPAFSTACRVNPEVAFSVR